MRMSTFSFLKLWRIKWLRFPSFLFFDNERKTHLEKTTGSFRPMRSFATRMKWSYKRDIRITGTVLIIGNHCALTMCQAQVNHNQFLIYSPQKSWEEGVIILTSTWKKKKRQQPPDLWAICPSSHIGSVATPGFKSRFVSNSVLITSSHLASPWKSSWENCSWQRGG